MVEGAHRRVESRVFYQDLFSPVRKQAESKERPLQVVCCRARDETGRLAMEERREGDDLKFTYLLLWPACFSFRLGLGVPRESLLELGPGRTGSVGRKVRGEH